MNCQNREQCGVNAFAACPVVRNTVFSVLKGSVRPYKGVLISTVDLEGAGSLCDVKDEFDATPLKKSRGKVCTIIMC